MHRSVYGRHLFAVGHNEEASRYSGRQTRAVIAGAYVVSGTLAAVSAIIIAFYTNSISPASHGNFYELYAIAAAVVGGCSLRGGEGSVLGIVMGTALLQVLRNLVNLLDIPSSLDFAVMGAVILIGAVADHVLRRDRLATRTGMMSGFPVRRSLGEGGSRTRNGYVWLSGLRMPNAQCSMPDAQRTAYRDRHPA